MCFYGWKPLAVSHHLSTFVGRWSSANGDIICLIFQVISQDHVIEGSCYFMGMSETCLLGFYCVILSLI